MKKFQSGLIRVRWSGPSPQLRIHLQACWSGFLFALLLCVLGTSASAQAPSLSWGYGHLSTSLDDCMARAKQAFELEGYSQIKQEGPNSFGYKGIHGALIICDLEVMNNQRSFHVFVGSNTNLGDIPGLERIKLANRMDNPTAQGTGGTGKPETGSASGTKGRDDFLGEWGAPSGRGRIYLEGGQLYCKNEYSAVTPCRIDGNTIIAKNWGDLVGTLSPDKRTLTWANNTQWTRLPDFDLGTPASAALFMGTWYRNGSPASVYNQGGQLYCKNEFGNATRCRALSSDRIIAIDWGNLIGTLSGDRQKINWANGTYWTRTK